MVNSFKKSGQRLFRKISRASIRASEDSRDHIKENVVERFSHVQNIRLLILEWSLLVTALIMLALTQAFWFGDSYAENCFVAGGSYTEATVGNVTSMNPLFATTNSEKVLSKLMFMTITTIDYSGNVGNQIAKSVTPSEEGKKWTVVVRDDLTWSDGEPITADDVVFTAGIIQNPLVNTIYASNLANVRVNKTAENTVVFDLPAAYADFNSALNIPVLPKHILGETAPANLLENTFSQAPITSGAFSFNAVQAGMNEDEKIFYLSGNPTYFAGKPLLNTFVVHTYNTKEAIVRAVNANTVTATSEISAIEAEKVTANNFLKRDSRVSSGVFIFFNMAQPVVAKNEVRSAIRRGINLGELREAAPGTEALNYPLLESQIKLSSYPKIPEANYDNAKKVIAGAFTEGKPHLNIATVNSGYMPAVTEVLKTQLEGLGFEVEATTYDETQEFINNVVAKRSYDILVYKAELGAEPDLLPYYHSSQASTTGLNLSNYKNFLVNDLLLGARETTNTAMRAAKYEKFLSYWVSEVPAIGLYQPNMTYFYNKNVRTFGDDVHLVTSIDRFTDVTNWAVNKETKNKTP